VLTLFFLTFSYSLSAAAKKPETNGLKEMAYVYGQPLSSDNLVAVLGLLCAGKYVKNLDNRKFAPGTSAWVYIPLVVFAADSSRNYLLTGYHDQMDIYKRSNGRWAKIKSIGKYVPYEKEISDEKAFI
jgi:hypothetical protein